MLEESPSPFLTGDLREAMGAAAVLAARAIDYVNAGTVEFIVGQDGGFYFMEINTRLPVCLLYTSPSPRDRTRSRMPSSA